MKYYWKVFVWENGHKGTEYTDYLIAPFFYEDRLDETLDTGEIILENMPIGTKKAFPPKTKFRIERYTTKDYSDTPRIYDVLVDHDNVEIYPGLEEFCTHRIEVIEVSVITQNMHIDNIDMTYELQDVNLNYKTTHTSPDKAISNVSPPQPGGGVAIRISDSFQYPLFGGGEWV